MLKNVKVELEEGRDFGDSYQNSDVEDEDDDINDNVGSSLKDFTRKNMADNNLTKTTDNLLRLKSDRISLHSNTDSNVEHLGDKKRMIDKFESQHGLDLGSSTEDIIPRKMGKFSRELENNVGESDSVSYTHLTLPTKA